MPPPIKPMLGTLELPLVQHVHTEERRALVKHAVPGREGAVHQSMGRRRSSIRVTGILVGADLQEPLAALRQMFQRREPVAFVADVAAGTRVEQVTMADLRIRELGGLSERLEYRLLLREYIPPPPPPPRVAPDALGPFGELVNGIDAMGNLPSFRDPTPPLLGMLDEFGAATEGLGGVLGALGARIGTPPES